MTYSRHPTDLNAPTAKSRLAVSLSMLCAGLITSVALAQGNANLPGASLAAALQQSEPTGRLIIKYNFAEKPGQSPRGSQKVNRSILRENRRLALQRKLSDTRELVESTTSTESIAQLKAQADRLTSQSDIAYASVEYRRYPLLEPNDPLYQGSQLDFAKHGVHCFSVENMCRYHTPVKFPDTCLLYTSPSPRD